ncbi:MAG: hypothetical protein WDW38_003510 [Sanguina aurantia]
MHSPALVNILYDELLDPQVDLSDRIQQGFGPHGLGILTVSGFPNVLECRQGLLPLASRFADLPRAVQEKYEDSASAYNFGWSHGKEAMRDGQKDTHKGSYYANPIHDIPTQDQGLIAEFPSYYRPNLWPAELPELEPAFKALGQLMCAAGELLMKRCDEYVSHANPTIPRGTLCGILSRSRNHKARLLHYFPPAEPQHAAIIRPPSPSVMGASCASTPGPEPNTSPPTSHRSDSSDTATATARTPTSHRSDTATATARTPTSHSSDTATAAARTSTSHRSDTVRDDHGSAGVSEAAAGCAAQAGRGAGSSGAGVPGPAVAEREAAAGLEASAAASGGATAQAQPTEEAREWCGWHTDHGSITALTSAIYTSSSGVEVPNPDASSGLYIEDRQGRVVRAAIGPSQIAFQVGEALQVHSGGLLRATPHCVRAACGAAAAGISRNTFAVFMQPGSQEPLDLPAGVSAAEVAVGQWQEGMDFGSFSTATFARYYGS